MASALALFLGISAAVASLGAVLLVLWAAGVFKREKAPAPSRTLSEAYVANSYTLSPTDTWVARGPDGEETRGIGIQHLTQDLYAAQSAPDAPDRRIVVFLLPGRYSPLHLQVGAYTSVVGLGRRPADTVVQGTIEVPNDPDPCVGALENNFRHVANLTLEVDTSTLSADDLTDPYSPIVADQPLRAKVTNYFRVSRASPIRNIVVRGTHHDSRSPFPHTDTRGNFAVSQFMGGCGGQDSGGYASGGFMANVAVLDGEMQFGTQQQFFARNCHYDVRTPTKGGGGLWNIYLLGCDGEVSPTPLGKEFIQAEANRCPPNRSDTADDNDADDSDDAARAPPLVT